jgi:para-nitrobenzyl esterase
MSEDCLNVNVATPALDNAARPVMVWLHGGGFWSGSGDWLLYDGAPLARSRDVVVVTVTHRLNAFGFLYLPVIGGDKYAEASNVGMRDMVLALEWVQSNIEAFGGNPDNVTIFGQSGGGSKVSVLTGMPAAQGRYHRGIIMSGSLLEGVNADVATETSERFMAGAGARNIAALQQMPWEQLNAEAERQQFRMNPTVDGQSLPAHPYAPAASPLSADVPLMIGTTEHEVNFFPTTPLDPIGDSDLTDRIRAEINADRGKAERLIEVYRAGRPGIANVDLYQILASDAGFGARAHTQAERKAAQSTAAVYKYYFTWQSSFAFDNVDVAASMTGAGQDRYALADRVSGAFTAFARSGDPNHAGIPRWPAFTANERATLIFANDCRVENDPHGAERRALTEVMTGA